MRACIHVVTHWFTKYLLNTCFLQELVGVTLSCTMKPFTSEDLLTGMVEPHGSPLQHPLPHFTVQEVEAQRVQTSCKRSDGY